ncbi:hypothetical protein Scep_023847 [Stephania cephalantha]|uniref:Uncharacterized protein n=1 Tax=Stephania cephalantha TaxID=152367 RepID=A0AAP0EYC3_9MAGN
MLMWQQGEPIAPSEKALLVSTWTSGDSPVHVDPRKAIARSEGAITYCSRPRGPRGQFWGGGALIGPSQKALSAHPIIFFPKPTQRIFSASVCRDTGVGEVGVTGLQSRDQNRPDQRLYKEGTGRSKVERDRTQNRRGGEGGHTCTDAAEKEEKEGCGRTGLKTTGYVVRGVSGNGNRRTQHRRMRKEQQREEEGGPRRAEARKEVLAAGKRRRSLKLRRRRRPMREDGAAEDDAVQELADGGDLGNVRQQHACDAKPYGMAQARKIARRRSRTRQQRRRWRTDRRVQLLEQRNCRTTDIRVDRVDDGHIAKSTDSTVYREQMNDCCDEKYRRTMAAQQRSRRGCASADGVAMAYMCGGSRTISDDLIGVGRQRRRCEMRWTELRRVTARRR